MTVIGSSRETNPSPWMMSWGEQLLQDDSGAVLAEGLRQRWESNVPDMAPTGLWMDPVIEESGKWWLSLELFLLNEDVSSGPELAGIVVSAFAQAVRAMSPDISHGDVWLNDLLALRRTINAAPAIQVEAARLLFYALDSLEGRYPEADPEAYQFADQLYRAVCESMVVELYEADVVTGQIHAGARVAKAGDFSLLYMLEKLRLGQEADLNGAEDFYEGLCESGLQDQYQEKIDALFLTLKKLTAQAFEGATTEEDVEKFDVWLERLESLGPAHLNNKAIFFGLQRALDIHWRRLCHVVSDGLQEAADRIIRFIELMAREDEYYASELEVSSLNSASQLVWKPHTPGLVSVPEFDGEVGRDVFQGSFLELLDQQAEQSGNNDGQVAA